MASAATTAPGLVPQVVDPVVNVVYRPEPSCAEMTTSATAVSAMSTPRVVRHDFLGRTAIEATEAAITGTGKTTAAARAHRDVVSLSCQYAAECCSEYQLKPAIQTKSVEPTASRSMIASIIAVTCPAGVR